MSHTNSYPWWDGSHQIVNIILTRTMQMNLKMSLPPAHWADDSANRYGFQEMVHFPMRKNLWEMGINKNQPTSVSVMAEPSWVRGKILERKGQCQQVERELPQGGTWAHHLEHHRNLQNAGRGGQCILTLHRTWNICSPEANIRAAGWKKIFSRPEIPWSCLPPIPSLWFFCPRLQLPVANCS